MKKKYASQSAFFNLRVLIGLFVVLAGIFLALIGLGAFSNALAQVQGKSDQKATTQQSQVPVSYERIEPASVSVIDFQKLAQADEKAARSRPPNEPPVFIEFPPPEFHSPTPPTGAITGQEDFAALRPPAGALLGLPGQALIPSPQPALSFLAQEDGAVVGTNNYVVPPDTTGAVGPDKLFVTLNRNYRVQDKSTGAILSEVSGSTFWSSTGVTYGGDPRVVFDPYNNRWLVSSLGGGLSSSEHRSILVGVSSTSDPQGMWRLFRFIVGCEPGAPGCNPNGESPDFDTLGFNKNWVVVSEDQFITGGSITGGSFLSGKLLILDYPALRAGIANSTIVTVTTSPGNFSMHPAATLSPTEETLYVPAHVSSTTATYLLHKITGLASSPVFVFDTTLHTRPGGTWTDFGEDIEPQTCIGTPGVTCPTTPLFISSGQSAHLASSVLFRNGNIWYSQTIGLPSSGYTHTAVQWTRIDTAGNFVDGGRVDDPTANSSNGGQWYGRASIAVNSNNDVLLGFSNFSSAQLASAGYAFRFGTDPPGTMRTPIVTKHGEDYYHRGDRWGDYGASVVDPTNDLDMWTIQEYARMRLDPNAQQDNQSSRWSTWWAKVCNPNVPYTIIANAGTGGTASGGRNYVCGSNVTVTATANACYTFANWTERGNVVSTFYEAESGSNTLAGGAVRQDWPWCSGGQKVGYVGNNAGTLQFNGVAASAGAGSYPLTIYYVNGDPTARSAYLSVNGGPGTSLIFPSTGGWSTVGSLRTSVNLNAGSSNTLRFYNPNSGSYAPDFDRIGVNALASYGFTAGANRTLVANFNHITGCTAPPSVTTNPATNLASFSATLNGSLNPNGLTTSVYFQYGTTPSYGSTTASQSYSGSTTQNVSANISGLTASTIYHFRIVATNSAGTTYGADRTFTTLSATGPPVVTTNPATNVTTSSATLHGSLDPHGLTTTVYFQYGTTTSYGHTTPMQSQTGNTYRNITANISGLAAHTVYHFRIVATNSSGTRFGSDRTFTTP